MKHLRSAGVPVDLVAVLSEPEQEQVVLERVAVGQAGCSVPVERAAVLADYYSAVAAVGEPVDWLAVLVPAAVAVVLPLPRDRRFRTLQTQL